MNVDSTLIKLYATKKIDEKQYDLFKSIAKCKCYRLSFNTIQHICNNIMVSKCMTFNYFTTNMWMLLRENHPNYNKMSKPNIDVDNDILLQYGQNICDREIVCNKLGELIEANTMKEVIYILCSMFPMDTRLIGSLQHRIRGSMWEYITLVMLNFMEETKFIKPK